MPDEQVVLSGLGHNILQRMGDDLHFLTLSMSIRLSRGAKSVLSL